MIQLHQQLAQATERMGRMQRLLEAHRRDLLRQDPLDFAVFAEGPLDEMRKLHAEIDDYVRRLEGAAA
ncbi:MAG: hypothetical protein L0Z50_37795 [Verrucomicrobiales bacterium]|nr:hypothetical protein [Verrucomicrobiales bacterium]